MTYSVNLNIICETEFKISITGWAFLPTATIASAKNIENTTICNKFPCAIASIMLVGKILVTISLIEVWAWVAAISPASCMCIAWAVVPVTKPTPGLNIFAIVSPIISARVVTISK